VKTPWHTFAVKDSAPGKTPFQGFIQAVLRDAFTPCSSRSRRERRGRSARTGLQCGLSPRSSVDRAAGLPTGRQKAFGFGTARADCGASSARCVRKWQHVAGIRPLPRAIEHKLLPLAFWPGGALRGRAPQILVARQAVGMIAIPPDLRGRSRRTPRVQTRANYGQRGQNSQSPLSPGKRLIPASGQNALVTERRSQPPEGARGGVRLTAGRASEDEAGVVFLKSDFARRMLGGFLEREEAA